MQKKQITSLTCLCASAIAALALADSQAVRTRKAPDVVMTAHAAIRDAVITPLSISGHGRHMLSRVRIAPEPNYTYELAEKDKDGRIPFKLFSKSRNERERKIAATGHYDPESRKVMLHDATTETHVEARDHVLLKGLVKQDQARKITRSH